MSSSLPSRASGSGSGRLGAPIERQHASDQVFREIASAVLRRELEPGSPLPPERELSERFGVSRIVVREAIHRLKEYELVRVRQGSPTVVLDPDDATDIRLLSLEIELMPDDEESVRSLAERQRYAGAAVLALAEQRMSDAEVDALDRRLGEFRQLADREEGELAFERDIWVGIARGSRNRIYVRETLWLFNLLGREERFKKAIFGALDARIELYAAIISLLRKRRGSADAYLEGIRVEDQLRR